MGRTIRKGGREADHKRRREAWKRQKGTKRIKETDDESIPRKRDDNERNGVEKYLYAD